jgi:glycosyltransferase involved in cell wall biosynthesis
MNVLWLGFSLPDSLMKEVLLIDPSPSVQTHKFAWSFARALKHGAFNVILASTVPVQNFPLTTKVFYRNGFFKSQEMQGVIIGFVNLLVLKHLTRFLSCILFVIPLIKRQQIKWVFVHGLHTPFVFFAILSRLMGCRIAIIMTDPPGVVLPSDGFIANFLKRLDAWILFHIISLADAVFALAPELVRTFSPNRPALIFPGILDSNLDFSIFAQSKYYQLNEDNKNPFTIVYAGGLSQRYGVDRLVDAVLGFAPDEIICLKLLGRGDCEDWIKDLASRDSRIIYEGFVDPDNLLPILKCAHLLINPRPTHELFASMSFPSKLIDYLGTGRPVLTTRIPSIPEELKSHLYFIYDESSEGIRSAIREVIKIPICERAAFGLAARKFVISNFSESAIGEKIKDFIDKM